MRCAFKQAGVWLVMAMGLAAFQAAAQEAAQETAQETAQEAAQETAQEAAQETAQETAQEVPETEAPVAVESGDQDTTVYLIREKKFVGGGRDVWVALNDKVVAAMDNGGHVVLKLKPGLNTLNGVQAKAGFAYAAVDDRPGETVYLLMQYLGGKITEVPAEQGLALVKDTKPQQVLAETRPNDGYDNLLVNPELLGLGLIASNA